MRFLIAALVFSLIGLLLDYYVYRNWRRFARRRFGWTVRAFAIGMVVMALVPPVYLAVSNWWEVDPKAMRSVVAGAWAVWYLPKLPIAAVLLVKDALRFATWLFGWMQARLGVERPDEARGDLAELPRISRAEFLRRVGWTAAGVPFAVVGYGAFRTLYDFDVRLVTVPIRGLPRALDGIRIAQLSDLHAGSLFSERPMEHAVDLVLAQRPDVVALTGDFVNNDHRELPAILPAIERLTAPLGVFGVRGNHDHYARVGRVSELIRAAGIDLLVNDARTLRIDGARLHLVGTDNIGFGQQFGDLPAALARTDRGGDESFVLMAHDPVVWDAHVRTSAPEVDLTLCGHTHGGQIGIELGPLRWSLARITYDRWAGLYAEPRDGDSQFLYVNRGIGTVGPPLRIGIRPEITILTLVRGDEGA